MGDNVIEYLQIPPILSLNRTVSQDIADACNTSRALARAAIDAAGGDINEAAANLLLFTLNPSSTKSPFEELLSRRNSLELASLGGISVEKADAFLAENGGDLLLSKQKLIEAIGIEAESDWNKDMDEISLEKAARIPSNFVCPICFDQESTECICLKECGHSFCKSCAVGWITAQMSETTEGLIVCPLNAECSKHFTQRELRNLIGTKTFATLDRRALETVVSIDPTLHMCSTPDCSYVVAWAGEEIDGPPVFICPLCKLRKCIACGTTPYHDGMNCHDFINQMRRSSDSSQLPTGSECDNSGQIMVAEEAERLTLSYLQSSNIRYCKRCNAGIVKSSGCDKLKCRCGYRFCYHCGSENAQCACTPQSHGFWDNIVDRGDFSFLRSDKST